MAGRGRWPALAGLLVGGALLLYALSVIALSNGSGGESPLAGRGRLAELFGGLAQRGAELGDHGAPVAITLVNDLQCRPCARYQVGIVPRLVAEYVRDGRAKLVLRHFAVGLSEHGIAEFASAAAGDQGREWQFDYLFLRNQDQTLGVRADRFLARIAGAVPDLDVDRWRRDRRGSRVLAALDADARFARRLGLPARSVLIAGPGGQQKLFEGPGMPAIRAAFRRAGGR